RPLGRADPPREDDFLQRSRGRLRTRALLGRHARVAHRDRRSGRLLDRRWWTHGRGGRTTRALGPYRSREHRRGRPHQFPGGKGTPARHRVEALVQEVREDEQVNGRASPPIRYIRGGLGFSMFRVRRPPEWGVEPVPHGLRVLRTFDLFVLWSSLGIGLLVLAAGTLLIGLGLTLAESAIVALVGSVLGSLMLAAAAHHGSRAGVPTMVSLRPILGRRGSYIPTALNVFQLLGWATFELLVMGIAAETLTGNVFGPSTALVFIPLFGAIVAALALGIVFGRPNFLAVIGVLGLGAFPLLIILVDETDNAFANVYSTAVSIQNLAPKRRQLGFIVAATLIAMAGAAFLWNRGEGIGGSYEWFLLLIGGLFVPLLGVVIADSFVVRRGNYAAEEFFNGPRLWRWSAFASWIPGAALYFVIVIFALPVGATLPSFALAA